MKCKYKEVDLSSIHYLLIIILFFVVVCFFEIKEQNLILEEHTTYLQYLINNPR